MAQLVETQEVACPRCGSESTVRVPERDAKLEVRPYVAAFGDHTEVECADGHAFWVYFC